MAECLVEQKGSRLVVQWVVWKEWTLVGCLVDMLAELWVYLLVDSRVASKGHLMVDYLAYSLAEQLAATMVVRMAALWVSQLAAMWADLMDKWKAEC